MIFMPPDIGVVAEKVEVARAEMLIAEPKLDG